MAENPGGSVSTTDPRSSNPLIHLFFDSNSDSEILLPTSCPNMESSCGNSSEKVMAALFGSASSAFTRIEKPDGSLPKSNYPSPDCFSDLNSGPNTNPELEFVSPSSAFAIADKTYGSILGFCETFLPDSVTLGPKLPVSVPLDDDDTNSLRGTDDGGNEGKVERKADEAIGIHLGTQPFGRENVEEIWDEEMDDLIEYRSICASSESDRDEIQHKSSGTLNAERHQVKCKLPEIKMVFSSEEAAYEFYKNYARNIGFCVRKGKVQRLANGKVRKKYFFCSRQGFRLKKQSNTTKKYKRKETRIGCKAMIQFTIENGEWVVSNLNLEHNHELVSPSHKCEIISCRKISEANAIIGSVNEAGMEKDVADAQIEEFHGMDSNNFSCDKKMNILLHGDVQGFANYLESLKMEDPSFFYKVEFDAENCTTNFFWRDWISKKDYDCFGDVLILDTTFRMDIYDMICAPFVGVNHHQQYILLGCAFLLDETMESFIWLFETFMEAMGGRQPKSIFTDDHPALANAIGKVLPETQHRLCMWHICQNATKHLSDSYRQPGFQSLFNKCIFYCHSKENFQSMWDSVVEQYNLHENSWLQSLYVLREKWSHIFSKKTFSASIESVRSGKGINDVFHNLTSETMTLKKFAQQYEKEAEWRRRKESEESYKDLHESTSPIIESNSLMEKEAANIYTRAVFKLFQEKLSESWALAIEEIASGGTIITYKLTEAGYMKESIVAFNCSDWTITCSCKNFESTGILCMHALKVLNARNIFKIPAQYILKRWTRYAKEGEVHDWGEETTHERKRSSSLDTSKLLQKAFNLVTKCGTSKDTWAIAEQYLNSALEKVNEHLKREKYLPNKRKGKEVDDLEDNNEVSGSNTSGVGCSENQKMVLSSPYDDRSGILKSTRMSKMKKRSQNVERQIELGI